MNCDTAYETSSLRFFAHLAQQVIGEVILHEKCSFPYVNNVTDWIHPELSFTFMHNIL